MPNKRPRISSQDQATTEDAPLGPSYLSRIPFEILAEILLETTSPRDLLAVARCSKFLCHTLVGNPASQFIWRRIRRSCKPEPIPDPTPNFTESSYAAFLFDFGNCEICNKSVKKPYASFALRIRICGQDECQNALKKQLVKGDLACPWVLCLESSTCLHPNRPLRLWPEIPPYHRVKEYSEAEKEIIEMRIVLGETLEFKERDRKRVDAVMLFSRQVFRWSRSHQAFSKAVADQNLGFAQRVATSEGWDMQDLLLAESHVQLHRHRKRLLEYVTQSDYDLIRPELDEQILRVSERRKRREAEKSLHLRRIQVEEHLHRLKSDGKAEPLPNLTTFRQLPVIKLVQNRTSTKPATVELKSPLIKEILHDELEKWRESARTALAGVLGLGNWRSSSKKKLHPVDRLTARFRCTRCSRLSYKYSEDECLDFAGACSHECSGRKGKRAGKKREWKADQFVADSKAISIVSKVLTLCNVDPTLRESLDVVKGIDARIMCLSCDAAIIMGFQSIIGHCHRHEDMQVCMLPRPDPSILVHAFSYGLSAKLLVHTCEAQRLRGLKEYGCRHCYQKRPSGLASTCSIAIPAGREQDTDRTNPLTSIPADSAMSLDQKQHSDVTDSSTSAPPDGPVHPTKEENDSNLESTKSSKLVLYTFDGLRSHCKTKHDIQIPHDEDFFRIASEAADSDDCHESKVVPTPEPFDFLDFF